MHLFAGCLVRVVCQGSGFSVSLMCVYICKTIMIIICFLCYSKQRHSGLWKISPTADACDGEQITKHCSTDDDVSPMMQLADGNTLFCIFGDSNPLAVCAVTSRQKPSSLFSAVTELF